MEKFQLKTSNRDIAIKPDALRKQGLMPAELYGNKQANQHLSVSQNEFEKVLRKAGESTVVDLVTDDGKAHNVLIHDVQRHFLTSRPIHVDFYEVSMTEKLTANVALEFVGEAPAVRTHGGTLVKTLDAVEVESLPADLPHNITVDVSGLAELTDVIHAGGQSTAAA
jgi:large subunit ribosomal protein L25